MANRITNDKAKSIAAEFILTEGDKIQTLLNTGYSNSYARNSNGKKVFENVLIRAEITRLQKKAELRNDITINTIQKEHEHYQRLAEEKGDLSAATANLIAKGKTIAAYTDNFTALQDVAPKPVSAEAAVKASEAMRAKLKAV